MEADIEPLGGQAFTNDANIELDNCLGDHVPHKMQDDGKNECATTNGPDKDEKCAIEKIKSAIENKMKSKIINTKNRLSVRPINIIILISLIINLLNKIKNEVIWISDNSQSRGFGILEYFNIVIFLKKN